MKIGDRVRKLKGDLRLNSIGTITGEMALLDGTKFFHVQYPEWSVPVLEFASCLGIEDAEGFSQEELELTAKINSFLEQKKWKWLGYADEMELNDEDFESYKNWEISEIGICYCEFGVYWEYPDCFDVTFAKDTIDWVESQLSPVSDIFKVVQLSLF